MEILATAGIGMLALTLLTHRKKKPLQLAIEAPPAPIVEKEVIQINRIKTPAEILRAKGPTIDNKDVINGLKLKMEPFCRSVIEDYYKKPFNKVSSAVKNPKTNRYLELDGYNQDLRVAFEYQGEQHYKYPNYFHRSKKEFDDQLWRDHVKLEGCKVAGIILIIIPYTIEYESYKDNKGIIHLGKKRTLNEVKEILLKHLKGLERG